MKKLISALIIALALVFGIFILISNSGFLSRSVRLVEKGAELGVYYLSKDGIQKDDNSSFILEQGNAVYIPIARLRQSDVTTHYSEVDNVVSIVTKEAKISIDTNTGKLYSQFEDTGKTVRTIFQHDTLFISLADLETAGFLSKLGASFSTYPNGSIYLTYDRLDYQFYKVKSASSTTIFFNQEDISTSKNLLESKRSLLDGNLDFEVVGTLSSGGIGYDFGDVIQIFEQDGQHGYVDIESVEKSELKLGSVPSSPADIDYTSANKINLTWEAVYGANPDTTTIPAMPGLNTISPTWHDLTNENGSFSDMSQSAYITWAKARGYKVWPAVTNAFDPALTNKFLNSYYARKNYISNLVTHAVNMGYDGINIDFEHIYYADKDAFTNFVNELRFEGKKQGLTMSIDVNVPGGAPDWSLFYDHASLGAFMDYVIVMTYDQYYAGSSIAGPVAGYDWVKGHMEDLVKIVPSEKLVLGVPLYTRVWREKPSDSDGKTTLSSIAVSMTEQNNFVSKNSLIPIWNDTTKLYEVEFFEGTTLVKVFIENAETLTHKVSIVDELKLGGVASWRRGYETQDVWQVLAGVNN